MRLGYLFVSLVALALVSLSAHTPLDASATESVIRGNNCNPSGGPALYPVRVLITNQYGAAMSVNYSYYDFIAAAMVDGGRVCVIPPYQSSYCTINVPVRLGGAGSGNATLRLQLKASFLDNVTETPVKTLNLTLVHSTTSSENNVGSIISSSEAQLTSMMMTISSVCDGEVCCGMSGPRSDLETAGFLLAEARRKVDACDFSGALSDTASASALVRHAQTSYEKMLRNCNEVLRLYKAARSNISKANSTIYSKAACGAAVTDARNELSQAIRYYDDSTGKIESDSYDEARALLQKALASAESSVNKSGECPQSSFEPPPVVQPSQPQTQVAEPSSDALSRFIGALGYIVIAAIIVVVCVALYISFGKKWLEGTGGAGEFGAPPGAPGKAELEVDHSKIDREFEEWLRQVESAEQEKQRKKKD